MLAATTADSRGARECRIVESPHGFCNDLDCGMSIANTYTRYIISDTPGATIAYSHNHAAIAVLGDVRSGYRCQMVSRILATLLRSGGRK
jgi:hypothetical protein